MALWVDAGERQKIKAQRLRGSGLKGSKGKEKAKGKKAGDRRHGLFEKLVGILTAVVTIGAPFIAVQAAATLAAREAKNPDPSDPVFSFEARNRGDRQRRVRLAAAIAGVLNLMLLMVGLS